MPEISCEVTYVTAPVPAMGVVHDWESGVTLLLFYAPGGVWEPYAALMPDKATMAFVRGRAEYEPSEEVIAVLDKRLKDTEKPHRDLREDMIKL